ncbi:hypothetical protein [Cohnella abietis]|uniref:Uncharacterized protein n=1 Tax=Cohnella abietis TaxID=2507935 RepID=A0A3T1D1P6_9BACL|nr:hypothetical protein [Cohnella abietis]BBI32042.1 hypothetical protein KCTCHS21_14410 [Cohnella abietis]
MTKPREETQPIAEPSFTKEQFLASKLFHPVQKDVLSVVLADGESYTIPQAQSLIKETLERKAN